MDSFRYILLCWKVSIHLPKLYATLPMLEDVFRYLWLSYSDSCYVGRCLSIHLPKLQATLATLEDVFPYICLSYRRFLLHWKMSFLTTGAATCKSCYCQMMPLDTSGWSCVSGPLFPPPDDLAIHGDGFLPGNEK